MFIKLPCVFNSIDVNWHQFKTEKCFTKFYSESRGGGSYFYRIDNLSQITDLLKPGLFGIPPTIVSYCEFTGSGLVTPHRDRGDKVALNFYIDTDDGITIFYKEPKNTMSDISPTRLSTPPIESLTETGRFAAQPFDCYLLDVSMIHGIQKHSVRPRTMLTFRWKRHDYKTILNSLNFNK